jgi:alkanesulfonate monooxygenase SsuD/methylene tetrahydromethanopterin reductase-like flavin-dependent oxidoreductase (luciferase family)
MTQIRFGVLYDFRLIRESELAMPKLYSMTIDQIERVDELGFDGVWLTEHHFVEDGYRPSPLTVSGAIAARTKRVRIGQDVLLVPHYHPVRLAEDLAVLDNLSDDRMMLGAGMGYVPSEFRAMGNPAVLACPSWKRPSTS